MPSPICLRTRLLAVLLLAPSLAPLPAQSVVPFQKHLLNSDSEFSAATAIDVNDDGQLDIVCGAWWYAAPTWTKHRLREVEQIRGRFDDYANLPLDVDGDGHQDIVSVNYRSKSLYWCRHPGKTEGEVLWDKTVIDVPGTSETGRLVDIDGDGQLDVLPSGTSFAAWYEIVRPGSADAASSDGARVSWQRHELPAELIGHGLGAGDVNGDGRMDIVCPRGWAEGPVDARHGRWQWHPEFRLARDCGIPILCHDVDRDGDMDLVWGRGHNIGLYWTEQVGPQQSSVQLTAGEQELEGVDWQAVGPHLTQTKWLTHAIDTSWASAHTLMLADIDGDGQDDVVTGKRYLGHDGRDPGENDPLSVQWYRFQPDTGTWHKQQISSGGSCGIDLDASCVDLDGDGDIDILAPARSGLHWLENLRLGRTGQGSDTAAAKDSAAATSTAPQVEAYETHDNFEILLQGNRQRPLATAGDHGIRRQQILQQMELVMGPLPQPSRRVPLAIQVEGVEDTTKYWRVKLSYAPEAGDRVPAYLLVPHEVPQPLPAMLCLHQTNFELGKAEPCGLGGLPNLAFAHELAEAGYVCLAPDYPSFADYQYDFDAEGEPYVSGSMKAIWNNIRAVDLLQSLPCVDGDRIGAIGHSLGGHNALYTAAFEQRLRAVISSCGFNAFEHYYGGDLKGWSSARYMPRIASRYAADARQMPFDFPEVLAAIAPRPMFVNAPLQDSNFAVVGVRQCQDALAPLLKMLGQPQRIVFAYPPAQHDFPTATRQQAYAWLEQQL
ncbi:MAG: VCBS repeat-containing protein [Planctomycetales bacterium]|nr:VCBS repeat-containing protein [Planctomycetales bacterium]